VALKLPYRPQKRDRQHPVHGRDIDVASWGKGCRFGGGRLDSGAGVLRMKAHNHGAVNLLGDGKDSLPLLSKLTLPSPSRSNLWKNITDSLSLIQRRSRGRI